MTERSITQREWNERPEQSDQTVAVLMALGFEIQIPAFDRKFDEHGTLLSERFTKITGVPGNGIYEHVTVDYIGVRTYRCEDCVTNGYPSIAVGLAADKYSHAAFHQRQNL